MTEDEWGFFVDLEFMPDEKKIKKKYITKIGKNKHDCVFVNRLNIIYEEEVWHKREDVEYWNNEYTIIKRNISSSQSEKNLVKKDNFNVNYNDKNADDKNSDDKYTDDKYNKRSVIMYCVICASFISFAMFY
jgi:hypothetical protein